MTTLTVGKQRINLEFGKALDIVAAVVVQEELVVPDEIERGARDCERRNHLRFGKSSPWIEIANAGMKFMIRTGEGGAFLLRRGWREEMSLVR